MLILGIETSGALGTVALNRDGQLLEERRLPGQGMRHAQSLTAEIALLCEACSVSLQDCDAVAVSVGPGSFTGLRIGTVCAKTLAYALGIPIVSVETFKALAAECPLDWNRVAVLSDAQRGDVFLGRFVLVDERWQPEGSIAILPGKELKAELGSQEIVVGSGLKKWGHGLPSDQLTHPEIATPHAKTICQFGLDKLNAGDTSDVWSVEPLYLRRSSAEEQWDRKSSNRPDSRK